MAQRVLLLLLTLLLLNPGPLPAAGYRLGDEDHPYDIFLPQIYSHPHAVEACAITAQSPENNTILNKGQSFEMNWTMRNGSSTNWDGGSAEIRFLSGDRVHIGSDVRDLGFDVAPNDKINIIIPMSAPSLPGSYQSNWIMIQEDTELCRFYGQFRVQ